MAGPSASFGDPGEDAYDVGPSEIEFGSLAPVVNESGFISVSIDGAGNNAASTQIQVRKPPGATVRRAFVAAASTGFSGRKLANGDVRLNNIGFNWQISTPSSINSWNHWAEVTSIVKPTIDGAAPGILNFTVTETSSFGVEGEILVVIFDDPAQTTSNTVILAFGAQLISGDTFNVALGSPLNKADPNLAIDFSLGISFGFQATSNANQRSIVNVNGARLTSVAGGQDDGAASNGALITVGGFDDSNANPDPNNTTSGLHYDDELYNLLPFVANGTSTITVFSQNPSNDDNIFFAALMLKSAAAIVGEGIVAGPSPAPDSDTGTAFTVNATVQGSNGNPVANRTVTFTVMAGPHAGTTGTGVTNASGQAFFTYTGTVAGMDEIKATFVDSQNQLQTSNTVLKRWIESNHAPSIVCSNVSRAVNDSCVAIVQPSEVGIGTTDADDDPFSLALNPAGPFSLGNTNVTLTATDVANMSSSCSAVITAYDDSLPLLSCPAPVVAECVANTSATVNVLPATGGDNCGAPVIAGPSGQSSYPLGATALMFTATDGSGNSASCSTSVTVVDTTLPTLSCAAPLRAECTGNHAADVNVPDATGGDSCSSVTIGGPAGVASYRLGTTSLAFTATDSSGNAGTCTTSVTVEDTLAPAISCPAPVTAECTAAESAFVNVQNPFAGDVCGGVVVAGPAGGAPYALGSTALLFSATDDANNAASCSSSITVVDTIAPSISCAAPITAECTGNHAADVFVDYATAGDSCSAVTVTGPGGSAAYPVGSTALTFGAFDSTGNGASCTTTVDVQDTIAPSISCAAPMIAECTGNSSATVDVPNATASDTCGGVAISGPAGIGIYALGMTSLGFSAADDFGNASSCSTTVIVADTIAPEFDASTLGAQTVLGNCDGSPVTFSHPLATDGCQAVTVACSTVNGNSFGTNVATCTATDGSGNQTSATITVNVLAPVRLAFQSPLADDNAADDINSDGDVANIFQVKQTIPNKIKLYSCSGADVTESLAAGVTLRLTINYRSDGSTSMGTSIVPTYSGVGDAGGMFVLAGDHFQYNQKTDPSSYPSGSVNSNQYFDNVVTLTYNSSPNIVAGREDARLESK